jgi:hypothetical protein
MSEGDSPAPCSQLLAWSKCGTNIRLVLSTNHDHLFSPLVTQGVESLCLLGLELDAPTSPHHHCLV